MNLSQMISQICKESKRIEIRLVSICGHFKEMFPQKAVRKRESRKRGESPRRVYVLIEGFCCDGDDGFRSI